MARLRATGADWGLDTRIRCGFDRHLYLISCLNAHNYNTCIRLPQAGCTEGKKWTLHYWSRSPNTSTYNMLTLRIWTSCPNCPKYLFRARDLHALFNQLPYTWLLLRLQCKPAHVLIY